MGLSPLTLLFLSLGATCAIISGYMAFQEIGEVNRRLSEDQQFAYYGFYPGKMQRIKQEYRRLYPKGRVETLRVVFQIASFVFVALAFVEARFLK
jgi:hypothetical protein